MTNNESLMSPDSSPSMLKKSGVRRVNNLPLIIVLIVFTVFVLLIAMVAMKRSKQQHSESAPVALEKRLDTSSMAAEIVSGHTGGIIMPPKPVERVNTSLALPVALIDNPDAPPTIENESAPLRPRIETDDSIDKADLDRIKMLKIEQFEDAVKAKMSITFSTPSDHVPAQNAASGGEETQTKLTTLKQQIALINASNPTAYYQARLQQIRASMSGESSQSHLQLVPEVFSDSEPQGDRWNLHSSVQAPKTPFVLRAGMVIPGTMISGIKPGLPGQIIGQVAQNVYDTATGKYLLIPQGTRLIGWYSNEISYGQDSVLVAWQRLVFPDGKALDIGSMPGADSAGYAGFHDQVNNHYVRIFGSALLMSGVVAGITYSQNPSQTGAYGQPVQPTAGSVMSAALGQELGQVTSQMIAKNLNRAPTLKIRPGYEFNVIVVKDITFNKPWQSFDY